MPPTCKISCHDYCLEAIVKCPVCDNTSRKLLHTQLCDDSYLNAPGEWNFWLCSQCKSAYLDPRLTLESIHLAYRNYYTHKKKGPKNDYTTLSSFGKFRRCLANGYANWRFGSQTVPSSKHGIWIAYVIPMIKRSLDRRYRNLLKPVKPGGKLLDVGCGNGSFLKLARSCGWEVVGLDPDPKAIQNAKNYGLEAYIGGIEYFTGEEELFDFISLNHVIEHVHNPVATLKSCYALLKPGGRLWVETPNIDSIGYARFKRYWRGLEVPRHLVLFNLKSLSNALIKAGFHDIEEHPRPSPCLWIYKESYAIEKGRPMDTTLKFPFALKFQAVFTSYLEMIFPSRREFLTLSTRKPKS